MMKSSNTPRRIYVHKLVPVVCFNAKSYRAGDTSKIDVNLPVLCETIGEGTDKIRVSQRKPHAKTVTETWVNHEIVRKARV